MNIDYLDYTSAGGRPENEDTVYVKEFQDGILAIVADGLGGHELGSTASHLAVDVISSIILDDDVTVLSSEEDDGSSVANILDHSLKEANSAIRFEQKGGNMCTTAAIVYILENIAFAAHIGDSRIYQFRDGEIIYQSLDHSVSQMAVLVGEISQSEIRGHRDRNRLLKALGASDKAEPDTDPLEVRAGDAFLVCSDGFWELILENEMLMCLEKASDAKSWLELMKECVAGRLTAKSDNNTAIAIIINE